MFQVHVDVSVWGNGGWRNNFLNLRTDHACSSGRKVFPNFGESLFAAAGYNFTKCPIPPVTICFIFAKYKDGVHYINMSIIVYIFSKISKD